MYNYYPQTNGINWVQGIEGAKAWQMLPNSNAVLMDSEIDGRFYIKVCDSIGMSTLRSFEFKEISQAPKQECQFITREEVEQMIKEYANGKQPIPAAEQK